MSTVLIRVSENAAIAIKLKRDDMTRRSDKVKQASMAEALDVLLGIDEEEGEE